MVITEKASIQLEPTKAKSVDTILGVIAQTVRGELRWAEQATGGSPVLTSAFQGTPWEKFTAGSVREYRASLSDGCWILSILQTFRSEGRDVFLTRLNTEGEYLFTEAKFAALDGLVAAVESSVGKA